MDIQKTVLVLQTHEGGTAHIIGIEHLSPYSTTMVLQLIRGRKPDTVIIELDKKRAFALELMDIQGNPNIHRFPTNKANTDTVNNTITPTISTPLTADTTDVSANTITSPPVTMYDTSSSSSSSTVAPSSSSPSSSTKKLISVYPQSGGFPGILPFIHAWAASAIMSSISDLYANVTYGGELVAGVEAGLEVNATIFLGDRDILLTLQRMGPELSYRELLDLIPSSLGGIHTSPNYTVPLSYIIQTLYYSFRKDWNNLSNTLEKIVLDSNAASPTFTSSLPGRTLSTWNSLMIDLIRTGSITINGKEALGTALHSVLSALEEAPELLEDVPKAISEERDILLANAIKNAPGETIVAVVGRGHLAGIAKQWNSLPRRLHPLEPTSSSSSTSKVPPFDPSISTLLEPPSLFYRWQAYGIPVLTTVATIGMSRVLWKRSRPLFMGYVTVCAAVIGTGMLFIRRVNDVRDRVRFALLSAKP